MQQKFYNIESEKALLGFIMEQNIDGLLVTEKVSPEMFYNEFHKKLYAYFLDMLRENKRFDINTITDKFQNDEHFIQSGGRDGLYDLMEGELPVTDYEDIIVVNYKRRVTEAAALDLLAKLKNTEYEEAMYTFSATVEKMTAIETMDAKTGTQVATKMLELAEFRHKNGNKMVGERCTDILGYDELFSGIEKGTLKYIVGDNASGKSSLANTIMKYYVSNGTGFYFWSGENSDNASMARLLSALSLVPTRTIQRGGHLESTTMETEVLTAAASIMDNTRFDSSGMSLQKLARLIPIMKAKGITNFILDRLELFEEILAAKNQSDAIAQRGRVTANLRKMCVRYGINVFLLMQFKSAVGGQQHTAYPHKNNIYGGSLVLNDAALIVGVHRPEAYGNTTFASDCRDAEGQSCVGRALLVVLKNNQDSLGHIMVEFIGANQFFRNIEGLPMPSVDDFQATDSSVVPF